MCIRDRYANLVHDKYDAWLDDDAQAKKYHRAAKDTQQEIRDLERGPRAVQADKAMRDELRKLEDRRDAAKGRNDFINRARLNDLRLGKLPERELPPWH